MPAKTLLYQPTIEDLGAWGTAVELMVCPKGYFDQHGCVPDDTYNPSMGDVYEANELLRNSGFCGESCESCYEFDQGATIEQFAAYMKEHSWEVEQVDFHELMHGEE